MRSIVQSAAAGCGEDYQQLPTFDGVASPVDDSTRPNHQPLLLPAPARTVNFGRDNFKKVEREGEITRGSPAILQLMRVTPKVRFKCLCVSRLRMTLRLQQSQVCQTLQSRFPGYESLSSLINAICCDYGFDPVNRAKEFGYFSFYEFLASDYMKDRVRISFRENGDALYLAVPSNESKHIFDEQLISYQHKMKRMIRARRLSVGGF
uniref:DUF7515 domain-containing protein n=1 Tax=Globodera rostochiensis TaxID=31243 RepID=A0A914HQT9_GLORO